VYVITDGNEADERRKTAMVSKWIHQAKAVEAMKNNTAGRVYLPTGAGKSRIEFKYAESKLIADDGKHQIVMIVAPTIVLCQQLTQDFYKFFREKEGNSNNSLIFVASSNIPKVTYNGRKVPSHKVGTAVGTAIDSIAHAIKTHKVEEKDTVIISTYASFDRAVEGIRQACDGSEEIYLLADEAHRFANGGENTRAFNALYANLDLFTSRFFLTATPKYYDGDESSMDQKEVYGEVIYQEKPTALIDRGVICGPRLWIADLGSGINESNFDDHVVSFILKTYLVHENKINEENGHNAKGRIGGKCVITVRGSKQLKAIIDSGFMREVERINRLKKGAQINTAWTMSDESVGMFFNGEPCRTKDEWLNKVRGSCYTDESQTNIKNEARLIVFHYDQLTEGIDIPSMNMAMFLRDMANCKVIQNTGRTLRVNPMDHEKDPRDKSTWVKPYSDVIVPNLVKRDIENIMQQFREEYDINHFYTINEQAQGTDIEQMDLQTTFDSAQKAFQEASEIHYRREMLEANRLAYYEQFKVGDILDLIL
jgi:superfamily II DNA or RNA helicase